MADYAEALKRPFSDLTKLLIYIVISIIPIVNIISSGYLLDVAQTAMKRQKKLPEFKDYGRLFVEGLKVIVISVIYAIPAIIVAVLAGASAWVSYGFGLSSAAAGLGILGMIVAAIIALIMIYMGTGAILNYADKRKLSEAFNFGAISKKVFTSKFFAGWILSIVISGIIGFVLGFIPLIGRLLGAGIGGIFYMSVMGEIYSEI